MNRWLGIQLDLIGVLVVFAACVCLVWTRNMSGGAAGLMITYAMKTTQNLSFAVRASTVCSLLGSVAAMLTLDSCTGDREHVCIA